MSKNHTKILSVAMAVAGLCIGGAGLYHNDYKVEMEKKIEISENQLEIKNKMLDDYRMDIFEKNSLIEKQQGEIDSITSRNGKLERMYAQIKRENDKYKQRSEAPSVSSNKVSTKKAMPSRGEQENRKLSVVATAYVSDCEGCIGITKTGVDVRNTIHHDGKVVVAVDPNIIPLHSVVKIEHRDGVIVGIAEDIGGDIKGNRIDVLVSNTDKAFDFGRQKVTLTVLREGRGS